MSDRSFLCTRLLSTHDMKEDLPFVFSSQFPPGHRLVSLTYHIIELNRQHKPHYNLYFQKSRHSNTA